MRIALGYRWFPTAAGYHIERALTSLGHDVTYVGLPCGGRPGYDSSVPIDEIIAALPEKPDLYLWVDPAGRYFPPNIERLTIPTACYLIDVHLGSWRERVASFFDAVFIAQKDHLPKYARAANNDQVYWLPLAAAPDVHRRLDVPKTYDVGFVGNIAIAHRGTPRARRLRLLADSFQTNEFYRYYPPAEVGEVYSQSRIVFNTSIAGDVTMRIFEGTAAGALVVTDAVKNGFGELFDVGKELVVYRDDQDLLEKVRYYLTHESEARAIAEAGYRRTHSQHTYAHRVQEMLALIQSPRFRMGAQMRTSKQTVVRAARREIYTHLHAVDAILDDERAAGSGAFRRGKAVWPALVRRLLR